jgi:hypothetical protein
MARGGRRRRVLNEEVRGASTVNLASYSSACEEEAPRYGEQANVEHHPQVTDFVPRKMRSMLAMLSVGVGVAAGAEAVAHYADPIAEHLPGVTATELRQQLAGGAVAWMSAATLLTAAMLAKLVYSLRRHRVDDYQGRYRVWRRVGWIAIIASIDSVVGAHTLIAQTVVAATGYSLTPTGQEWWLAPTAIVGIWIFVRLTLEIAECRLATGALIMAAGCYGAAAAGTLGWSPSALGGWSDAFTTALPLVGHTIGLVGLMIFARYVVLDVQGLIEHAPRLVAPAAKPRRVEPRDAQETATLPTPAARSTQAIKPNYHAGDDMDDEEQEDSGNFHKLSKAERKKLRRQNRAA